MAKSLNNNENEGFMTKVATFIVDKRILFFCIFGALVVFSVFSSKWVNVENDIIAYLSEDTETKQGLEVMDKEFVTYGTADVMVKNISAEDADSLAEELENTDGISSVEFDSSSESSYKNDAALYYVTFAYSEDDDEQCTEALDAMKQTLSGYDQDDVFIYTQVGDTLSNIISHEMSIIVIIVALVVVAVLIFTSHTYAEVPVLLATFLAAAIINKGTNFLMGTISFVSNSVTIVLQLALSLDYAIILCNRYKEEHALLPVREAAIKALSKAIPSIAASSLTTIAGLAAMTLMQFGLGLDMGLVLIKAIIWSLLSVFLLMPGLLVVTGGLMDKTKHRRFVPNVSFIGRNAYATRYIIPPVFVVVLIAAYIIFGNCNYVYGTRTLETPKENETELAQKTISENFGTTNMMAVIVPGSDYETQAELIAELESCDEVDSVVGLANIDAVDGYKLADEVTASEFASIAGLDSTTAQGLMAYYGASHSDYDQISDDLSDYKVPLIDLFLFLHDEAENGTFTLSDSQTEMVNGLYDKLSDAELQLQSDDYSRILVYLDLPNEGDETFSFIDRMHDIVGRYYDNFYIVGDSGSRYELQKSFETDNTTVSLMSILFVLIILLFTFKSIALPIMLIMVIQGSIWINFALPTLMGTNVFFMSVLIVSAIQMGANIDYAIVISSRYIECRKDMQPREAIIKTMNLAFPTVITSGTMMVIAGLLIGRMSSEAVIEGIGKYVGIGTLITLFLVMLVLPQILLFGDNLVRATTVSIKHHVKDMKKLLTTVSGSLLLAVCLFMLIAAPLGIVDVKDIVKEHDADASASSSQIDSIEENIATLDAGEDVYDASRMSYAEEVVTDEVGQEELSEGESEYNAGAEELADGQAQYDAAAAKLADAEAQYAASQQQLVEGKQEYKDGEAELEDAKEQYSEGQAKLDEVKPIYDVVLPLYNDYQDLLEKYNEAKDDGDLVRQALLLPQVTAAKALYTTEISDTGYSIESLINEYQAGEQQLADAAQQISDGQAQLDAAAEQIEEGQEQLDAAAEQIEEGREELAAAKEQLDAGYDSLDDAKAQLDSGKQTLEDNSEKMSDDLDSLEQYDDARQMVEAGITILMQNDAIAEKVGDDATYSEICISARQYLEEDEEAVAKEMNTRTLLYIAAMVAALIGLVAGILCLSGDLSPTMNALRAGNVLACIVLMASLGLCFIGKNSYVYSLADGSGTGTLQYAAFVAMFLTAALCCAVTFWRMRASRHDDRALPEESEESALNRQEPDETV